MRKNKRVADMVEKVLERQVRDRAERTGEPLEDAPAPVMTGSNVPATTGADVCTSPLPSLLRRHKFAYLGVYFAYGAPDVGFEQATPIVVLDTPDIAQRCFHRVADVVESRKQLLQILMLVHHISPYPSESSEHSSPPAPLLLPLRPTQHV
jgi:hypothetical protein